MGNASNACNELNTSNHCFGSRFAYDQHRRSFRLIGTACYTGNDDQHHELISSRRSNISTALLRIGHARSRASRWPTHIIKAITNIPLKNRIILHFWHYYVWLPGWTQNPTREPDIIMLKIRFFRGTCIIMQKCIIHIIYIIYIIYIIAIMHPSFA